MNSYSVLHSATIRGGSTDRSFVASNRSRHHHYHWSSPTLFGIKRSTDERCQSIFTHTLTVQCHSSASPPPPLGTNSRNDALYECQYFIYTNSATQYIILLVAVKESISLVIFNSTISSIVLSLSLAVIMFTFTLGDWQN